MTNTWPVTQEEIEVRTGETVRMFLDRQTPISRQFVREMLEATERTSSQ